MRVWNSIGWLSRRSLVSWGSDSRLNKQPCGQPSAPGGSGAERALPPQLDSRPSVLPCREWAEIQVESQVEIGTEVRVEIGINI
mmetsp:Transcript_11792/g.27002  ORF Transcript_11792/g.27002 Transcript_11792/m.27002 type:complete len:84 (+) Transcript_11792:284-535(+)|eukprot:CAMPEP_0181170712 /NCGR_PEP_ID=MMETSP1096-20121128/1514_1 /TAXON_ID=156174 ORGANISM="Chrysochromulina ericina, Strain CCMP281" /NCGR_SAMPLE_ID=MMETSP1096 /ASSEMBLY_ACC=CAM_ASM_000453 /LENGTH=83 /DNA_ID=CAMNT_0023258295 /DNA_START=210 /DNA_END=461 /DNA_ORIENTATION=-